MREVLFCVLLWLSLSAGIFAAIHAELGGMNVFLALLLGLIAAWFYERSGVHHPRPRLHAAWNPLTLAGIYGA